jgi:DNA-3-methyladenine glycosylase
MVRDKSPSLRPLGGSFFRRPTLEIAPDLLGCSLYVVSRNSIAGGRIVEVEAYIGEDDPACHAFRGKSKRNAVMYGPPGRAYVYFTYGNHWMLNVVTELVQSPAAVLIRAIEPTHGIAAMRRRRIGVEDSNLTNGPGKLTAALGINGDDNGAGLDGPRLFISKTQAGDFETATSGRVGVSEGSEIPWRFFVAGNPWVSPYRRGTRATRRQ